MTIKNPASISRAAVSFRIGVAQWLRENRFRALLELLARHPGIADELAFFTSETHPPLPLDTVRARAGTLQERMAMARARGFRAGINILGTIGHHNENLEHSLDGDFTRMTALDGRCCQGSFCPNDKTFLRDYVVPLYQIIAGAAPDFIWIDDDIRLLGHMPIPGGCFCDGCLDLFARECGTRYTRRSLQQGFSRKTSGAAVALRKAWLEHNRRTLARLFRLIERTVHAISPRMPLGFMTGERFYEGYDFAAWARILSGPRRTEVMWRPGGGFYSDEKLDALVDKAHDIGRQVSLLPDRVVSIQSEIENFPYQVLKKSARTTVLEAAAHIAAGCTGAAFNVLSMNDEPLDEYASLVAGIHAGRPFLDLLARTLGRSRPTGLHTGWNRDSLASCNLGGSGWPWADGNPSAPAQELFQIGLPVAYSPAEAAVTALSGDQPLAMSKAEIRRVLSTGVYMDAQALQCLNDMGYGEQTGFDVARWVETDGIEAFTEDPLNGELAGRRRDARQSFLWWWRPAAVLRPRHASARVLARLVDYAGEETAPCCCGVFENAWGGRVCVAGYYPWTYLQSLSKSAQVKAVMRWLSRDALDAWVESYHRIHLWVRRPRQGELAVALLNASLDPAENVAVWVRTRNSSARVCDMDRGRLALRAGAADGACRRFVIPCIEPWSMRLILI